MIEPRYQDSVAFLRDINPDGPWNLIAIDPDGKQKLVGKSFTPDQQDIVLAWLTMHGDRNLYYTLNPIMSMIDTKPNRADIKELAWLHVDLDPRAGEDPAEEKKRIQKLVDVMEPKPTYTVFSGGGYQCMWKLNDPMPINGKAAAYDEAKLYNLQLEQLFDADNCHNVDRILRLPGTVNHPSKRKREKGRTEQLATVYVRNDVSYSIKDFTKCQMVQSADQGLTKNSVQVSENVARLPDLDSLEEAGVNNHCRVVISKGGDPDEPHKYEDRSDAVWYVVCELTRKGIDSDVIFSILTDKDWGISAHVLDQPRPRDYAIRQIERAQDFAVEPALCSLNDRYAIVQVGGKTKILKEDTEPFSADEDRPVIRYMSFTDFKNYFGNEYVTMENKNGKGTTSTPLGLWWTCNPDSRKYEGVVFAPGRDVGNRYNLWKGFAYESRPGDCSLFLSHIEQNICQGVKAHFDYLVGWMARCVQRPDRPGETALVFRGKPGVGKGFFANQFGKLLGRHFLPLSNSDHMFGKFNAHLQECVLLFADECFGVSDKKQEGQLKALITEATVMSEGKGLDARVAPNYIHLIMASNEGWVVPIGNFDRRFFVLDVGDDQRCDRDYFKVIVDQLEAGGYEALLHYLLTYDIEDYDVTAVPKTEAHAEQAAYTMNPIQSWWNNMLQEGQVMNSKGWPSRVWVDELYENYTDYMRAMGKHAVASNQIHARFMRKVLPGTRIKDQVGGTHMLQLNGTDTPKNRPMTWILGLLDECRDRWDREMGAERWDVVKDFSDVPPDEGDF